MCRSRREFGEHPRNIQMHSPILCRQRFKHLSCVKAELTASRPHEETTIRLELRRGPDHSTIPHHLPQRYGEDGSLSFSPNTSYTRPMGHRHSNTLCNKYFLQDVEPPAYLLVGDGEGHLSILPSRTDSKFFAIDVWKPSWKQQVRGNSTMPHNMPLKHAVE